MRLALGANSAADKEKDHAFYKESMKIGTHGQNCILNKMRPKATSGLTFGDLYILIKENILDQMCSFRVSNKSTSFVEQYEI